MKCSLRSTPLALLVPTRCHVTRRIPLAAAACSLLACLLTPGLPAWAFFLESFQLDPLSWNATHVLVVSEGETIDGKVRVLESWKGDVERGEEVTIDGLKRFANSGMRRIHDSRGRPTGEIANCDRMVVFLVRDSDKKTWKPADSGGAGGGLGVSVAWIHAGRAYANAQIRVSGPQILWKQGNEEDLRDRVIQITALRNWLDAALDVEEAEKRIAELKKIARCDVNDAIDAAVQALASEEKPRGSASLRSLLSERSLGSVATLRAAGALSQLEGESAGAFLVSLLEKETALWQDSSADLDALKTPDRIDKAQYLVEVFTRFHYPPAEPAIRAFQKTIPNVDKLGPYRRTLDYSCNRALKRYEKTPATSPPEDAK